MVAWLFDGEVNRNKLENPTENAQFRFVIFRYETPETLNKQKLDNVCYGCFGLNARSDVEKDYAITVGHKSRWLWAKQVKRSRIIEYWATRRAKYYYILV